MLTMGSGRLPLAADLAVDGVLTAAVRFSHCFPDLCVNDIDVVLPSVVTTHGIAVSLRSQQTDA